MKREVFTDTELKYVVAYVEIDQKKEAMLITIYCPVGTEKYYHSESVKQARREGFRIFDIAGGGRIMINHESKVIEVFGGSGSYGEAETEIVKALIQEAMEEEGYSQYKLTITGTY